MKKTHRILLLLAILATSLLGGCTKKNTGNIYKLTEFLDDETYGMYIDGDDDLFNKLGIFKDKLMNSSDEIRYYSYAENCIEVISLDIPDECVINSGNEFESESRYELEGDSVTCVNAIQVSDNFFSLFPIEITEGREFNDDDRNYQNSEFIPVILGNRYRDILKVGSTFEGYYILEKRTFKVVGFAGDSDFYLSSQNSMVSYNNYIVMPFMNVENDSFVARAVLLQQVAGYVEYKENGEKALGIINKYLEEAGLGDWAGSFCFQNKELTTNR